MHKGYRVREFGFSLITFHNMNGKMGTARWARHYRETVEFRPFLSRRDCMVLQRESRLFR